MPLRYAEGRLTAVSPSPVTVTPFVPCHCMGLVGLASFLGTPPFCFVRSPHLPHPAVCRLPSLLLPLVCCKHISSSSCSVRPSNPASRRSVRSVCPSGLGRR